MIVLHLEYHTVYKTTILMTLFGLIQTKAIIQKI